MHTTIFLTEMGFMMLPLFEVIYLHTTITLRGEKETTLVVKAYGSYGGWLGWFSRYRDSRLPAKELIQSQQDLVIWWIHEP